MFSFLKDLRVVAVLGTVASASVAAGQAQPAPADQAKAGLLRVSAGIVVGVAVAQSLGAPAAWPRTYEGAARRLADQSGFVAVRSLSQLGISRVVPWRSQVDPCPSAIGARARCAIAQTLIVHTRDGAARPDIARIGGLTVASLGSLLWRPERATRGQASAFVLSRIGSGLVFAAVRRGVAGRHTTVPQ